MARRHFEQIYSIELDEAYFRRARDRFAPWPDVSIVQGDSAAVLPSILQTIDGRCLFWLDAHYSGGDTARGQKDTPIEEELKLILSSPLTDQVILIDDARDFNGTNDYPTVGQVADLILMLRPKWSVGVRDDIIRAHPPIADRFGRMRF